MRLERIEILEEKVSMLIKIVQRLDDNQSKMMDVLEK